jgi:hypothetical protein
VPAHSRHSYPESMTTSHAHRTLAYLPTDVAAALRARPQLVAAAVRCFYERDPVQLKACRTMARFPPAEATPTLVRMTRPLYAQLVAQRFYAPKPFEKARWFDGVEAESVDYRRRDVGMKLVRPACARSTVRSRVTGPRRPVALRCSTRRPSPPCGLRPCPGPRSPTRPTIASSPGSPTSFTSAASSPARRCTLS